MIPKKALLICTILLTVMLMGHTKKIVPYPLDKLPMKLPTQEFDELQGRDAVWVTQVVLGDNSVLPVTLMLYTNETWISSIEKGNVKAFSCNVKNEKCTVAEKELTKNMLTYKITGTRANFRNHHFIYTSDFDYAPGTTIQGAIGLGVYNEPDGTSFPYAEKDLDPIFAIYISRNFVQSSKLTLGGYDSQYVIFNARFQRVPAESKKDWTFKLNRMGDQSLDDAKAILDPNLPYIGIPESKYESFLKDFTTQEGLKGCDFTGITPKCDCDNFKSLPTLYIVLGGVPLEIPPSIYTSIPYTSFGKTKCSLLVTKISADGKTAFGVTKDYADTWILGEPFMSYFYTVFYPKEGYIEVAPSKEISTTMAAWIVMILLSSLTFVGAVLWRCRQLGRKGYQNLNSNSKDKNENDGLSEQLMKRHTVEML